MDYNNPVIAGFYPDPSVCRAGNDFFLVTSSFEYFPSIPIFQSHDLVRWQQIGHCLTRESQALLVATSAGIYAPTIRFHSGRFYVATTNIGGGGNFFVWAEDPAGPWSEPLWVDQEGIDPSLFFDNDGQVYFTSESGHGIIQSTIDIETGRRLSESLVVWAGTGGRSPEAPHLYKITGSYYLMIAEGGTEYGHMETIARSASPWGPFEPCPYNPILTHRNRGTHPIQATGHADLIQAQDGTWWAVFLGIRPAPVYPPWHILGRETFLAPVVWSSDGWPIIGHQGTVEMQMEGPRLAPQPGPNDDPPRDKFPGPLLAAAWNFRGNPKPEAWAISSEGLVLRGAALSLDDPIGVTWVGRRQAATHCRVATLLDFNPAPTGEEAGLTVLMNERHHYEIFVRIGERGREVAVRRRIGNLLAVVAVHPLDKGRGAIELHLQCDGILYRFGFAACDQDVTWLAEGEARYLSSEVAGGFTGVYFGLYSTGNGIPITNPALFHWFEYFDETNDR